MKNEAVMEYPASLYPAAIIRQAIRDYQNICTIRMESMETGIRCCFCQSCYDLDQTVCEFSNYLIELQNQQVNQC